MTNPTTRLKSQSFESMTCRVSLFVRRKAGNGSSYIGRSSRRCVETKTRLGWRCDCWRAGKQIGRLKALEVEPPSIDQLKKLLAGNLSRLHEIRHCFLHGVKSLSDATQSHHDDRAVPDIAYAADDEWRNVWHMLPFLYTIQPATVKTKTTQEISLYNKKARHLRGSCVEARSGVGVYPTSDFFLKLNEHVVRIHRDAFRAGMDVFR